MAIDPVDLIRGEELPPAWFRCTTCGARALYSVPLPTGGVTCVSCVRHIGSPSSISYAPLRLRLLAIVVDSAFLVLPYFLLALGFFVFGPTIAKDAAHRTTENATLVLQAIATAWFVGYFWAVESLGVSAGKRVMGLRVVRTQDWRRPGPLVGLVRLTSKALIVATLGVGYLILVFDPERRALHDWIAGTRVIGS